MVSGYTAGKETEWHGGTVYVEKEYPNILFAKDREIFELDGLKTIAIQH